MKHCTALSRPGCGQLHACFFAGFFVALILDMTPSSQGSCVSRPTLTRRSRLLVPKLRRGVNPIYCYLADAKGSNYSPHDIQGRRFSPASQVARLSLPLAFSPRTVQSHADYICSWKDSGGGFQACSNTTNTNLSVGWGERADSDGTTSLNSVLDTRSRSTARSLPPRTIPTP